MIRGAFYEIRIDASMRLHYGRGFNPKVPHLRGSDPELAEVAFAEYGKVKFVSILA